MTGALKLDRMDLKILTQLQLNGRITNLELAGKVGLSPSPCLMRVKRLEKAGYISGYGARIELRKLGDTVTVFTEMTLSDHRSADFAKFEARIRAVNEITECYLVSGGYDYLLKFVMRSINHYQETIEDLLATGIGIEKYFSYVVIKPVFVKQHLDLASYFSTTD
jgi:DNA-binding Lrp family transcriptional regulator